LTEKIYGIARFTFAPADAEAVLVLAKACMAASKQDLTGHQAYEWFMAPDAHECTVIEIYDGMQGLSHHGRAVGKIIPEILARTKLDMTFAGDMPPDTQTKYRKLFPNLRYSGQRMFGKCRAPASAVANPQPCQKIFAVTRFSIHPGQESQFLERAQDAFNLVDQTEPGTSAYEWFINEAGTECLTLDIYDSAEALLAHTRNANEKMSKVLELVTSSVEMFGAVPPAMLKRFRPELGVAYIAPQFQGIL
jgi:quinol monooxygenase YgiN